MSRKFIATILATAITVTAITASPSRAASGEDIAKVAVGAAALFLVVRALKKDRPRVGSKEPYTPPPSTETPYRVPRPALRDPIPAHCLKRHDTRDGEVRMVGLRCVTRDYAHAHRLPESCRVTKHTFKGLRHGYKPRCLRRQGYKLAGY